MRDLRWTLWLGPLFCLFQNCSPFESVQLDSFYPYASQPQFFYDLQLVRIEEDELLRQRFVFDGVVSFVQDPTAAVSYQIDFSTLIIPAVCQSQMGEARTQASKHFQVSCLLPVPDNLYVQMSLTGPAGETQQEQFQFLFSEARRQ